MNPANNNKGLTLTKQFHLGLCQPRRHRLRVTECIESEGNDIVNDESVSVTWSIDNGRARAAPLRSAVETVLLSINYPGLAPAAETQSAASWPSPWPRCANDPEQLTRCMPGQRLPVGHLPPTQHPPSGPDPGGWKLNHDGKHSFCAKVKNLKLDNLSLFRILSAYA